MGWSGFGWQGFAAAGMRGPLVRSSRSVAVKAASGST